MLISFTTRLVAPRMLEHTDQAAAAADRYRPHWLRTPVSGDPSRLAQILTVSAASRVADDVHSTFEVAPLSGSAVMELSRKDLTLTSTFPSPSHLVSLHSFHRHPRQGARSYDSTD